MPTDHIRYDLLAQEALRAVVRRVLADVAKNGPPGDHHFYITFDTRAAGVKLSPRLRAQYPEEMRIVLQHQFWDLTVTEEAFEVGLSFGSIGERLTVPFAAITAFLDPSVQFALQFVPIAEDETAVGSAETPSPKPVTADATPRRSGPTGPQKPPPGAPSPQDTAARPSPQDKTEKVEDDAGPPTGGGEVVRLDRFRKK